MALDLSKVQQENKNLREQISKMSIQQTPHNLTSPVMIKHDVKNSNNNTKTPVVNINFRS
jgi:hypothetical protein